MGRRRKQLPLPTDQLSEIDAPRVKLDKELIAGFQREYLWDSFDEPDKTPAFHLEMWDRWCSDHQKVASAAPRGHAKTTGCTVVFGLAAACFGANDHILIVSSNEKLAAGILGLIVYQLVENQKLREDFDVRGFVVENETEVIVRFGDRYVRYVVKGAEQRLRGLNWRNKRPNLILVDDLEEDEQVENPERRLKLRNWFNRALMPIGGKTARFRMHGTIMHEDSLLNRLMKTAAWHPKVYSAHKAFDDFSEILWPERFPEHVLREKRQAFIDDGDPHGYAREYLNIAIVTSESLFKPKYFADLPEELRMGEWDDPPPRNYYGSVDLAVSEESHADNTSFLIGGTTEDGFLDIVDNVAGRFDPLKTVNHWFTLHMKYQPEFWVVETGSLEKMIGPFLYQEMRRRGIYFRIETKTPTKSKTARAKSIIGRMASGSVRFDKLALWYAALEVECQTFPRGVHDDRVDSLSLLGLALEDLVDYEDTSEDDYEAEARAAISAAKGQSRITGY